MQLRSEINVTLTLLSRKPTPLSQTASQLTPEGLKLVPYASRLTTWSMLYKLLLDTGGPCPSAHREVADADPIDMSNSGKRPGCCDNGSACGVAHLDGGISRFGNNVPASL
jgi:hypothetical protein